MKKAFLLLALLSFSTIALADAPKESVYDRVMRTQTIRCGYGLWGIYLSKDPNTGKFGGIYYDLMEEMGKVLNLKIEWKEEVGWGDYIAGLVNDRFDAYCTIVGLNAERSRQVDFITPMLYLKSGIVVRKDDARFDNNLAALNDPKITLTTVEGDIYGKISARDFPLAKKYTLPQLATQAEMFTSVADGKTDAFLVDSGSVNDYMRNNPGKIRLVKLDTPLPALPASVSVRGGEYRFQRMLDITAIEMLANGSFRHILDKYDPKRTAVMDAASGAKETK